MKTLDRRFPKTRKLPGLHFKVIVNCGPCEDYIGQCLDSIRVQNYTDWEAHVTVDPSGDNTTRRASAVARRDARVRVERNRIQRYSLSNTIQAIRRSEAGPEDVVVCLDGDDWFSTRDALRIIAETYREHDCWVTYGSWQSNVVSPDGRRDGLWPAYPEATMNFRHTRWLGTAVRTWKRWIWDRIRDEDLRNDRGQYFRISEDQAVMLPLLEMSGTARARHVAAPIMIYNKLPKYVLPEELVRERDRNGDLLGRRKPYQRLEDETARAVAV